jgi:hypothetical protein
VGIGLLGFLAAACQPPEGDDAGAASTSEEPVMGANGLTINGLTTNGLTTNGLTTNGLTTNGLTTNGLTTNGLTTTSLAALRDKTAAGDVTRLFFRYLVSCALPVGHDLAYSWTDGAGVVHAETASGQFGLAPAWETGGVDVAGQELVSACLFARTNALGMSVPISMRGDSASSLAVTADERGQYHYGEGAFWGNAFANPPYGYSCSHAPLDVGTKSSADTKNGRICASQDCGMIHYTGACYTNLIAISGQACFRKALNNDWVSSCNSSLSILKTTSSRVITTWLRP